MSSGGEAEWSMFSGELRECLSRRPRTQPSRYLRHTNQKERQNSPDQPQMSLGGNGSPENFFRLRSARLNLSSLKNIKLSHLERRADINTSRPMALEV